MTSQFNTVTFTFTLAGLIASLISFSAENGFRVESNEYDVIHSKVLDAIENPNGRELVTLKLSIVDGKLQAYDIVSIRNGHIAIPRLDNHAIDSFRASGTDILILFGAYCEKNAIRTIGENVMSSLVALANMERTVTITFERDLVSIMKVSIQ